MGVVTPMNPTRTPARSTTSYGRQQQPAVRCRPRSPTCRGSGRPRSRERTCSRAGPLASRSNASSAGAPAAVEQPPQLVHALVELVVAERGHVEADAVGRLDRRLVVEVGRGERRGAHEVARVDLDRAAGQRGAVEAGGQPGRAAEARSGRLEVAVEVVDAQQCAASPTPGSRGCGALGARVQRRASATRIAARKAAAPSQQMTAARASAGSPSYGRPGASLLSALIRRVNSA